MLFRNKKAAKNLSVETILDLFIAVGVFLAIYNAVNQTGIDEATTKQLFVTQLGFELQAIQAVSSDVNLLRTFQQIPFYPLVFEPGNVYLTDRTTPKQRFLFTGVPGMIFNGITATSERSDIALYKYGNQYGASTTDQLPSPYLLSCAASGSPVSTLFVQSFEPSEFGAIESQITRLLLGYDSRIKTSRGTPVLDIRIRSGKTDSIKAYYRVSKNTKPIACSILNKLTTVLKVPVRLVPLDEDYLFSANEPSDIQLEIITTPNGIATKSSDIASAIYQGVFDYGLE